MATDEIPPDKITSYTIPKIPHIILCGAGAEGIKNFDTIFPKLEECPLCGKPRGTGAGYCNFTISRA